MENNFSELPKLDKKLPENAELTASEEKEPAKETSEGTDQAAEEKDSEKAADNEEKASESEEDSEDEADDEDDEESGSGEKFWSKGNIAGLVFICCLIIFNIVIYTGVFDDKRGGNIPSGGEDIANKRDIVEHSDVYKPEGGDPKVPREDGFVASDGKPHDDDPPAPNGTTPPKDAFDKPAEGRRKLEGSRKLLFGTNIVKGVIYFADTDRKDLRLSEEQRKKISRILAKISSDRKLYDKTTVELASYLTPKQAFWYSEHRGDPEVAKDQQVREDGLSPVGAAAVKILDSKRGSSKDAVTSYKHKISDIMLNDVFACIVKCEDDKELAVTPEQAAAMYPLIMKLKQMDRDLDDSMRFDLADALNEVQVEWLAKHVSEIGLDLNTVVILYAENEVNKK